MKKFSKILIFALSLVIAVSAFAIASSANTSPFLVEGLYRETWEEAVENAYIKGDRIVPVELLRDCEAVGESVEITESVVISLNGHTLKSETGVPLFTVSGKDTTLTIVGPGTISLNGTLANVESGTLVLDASNTLKVTSEGGDSAFVIGGEEKAYATVLGALDFESSGADLFEMAAGSTLEISDGNAVNAKPTSSAKEAFGIAFLHGNSKVSVSGGASLSNLDGGYIFKVDDGAGVDNPVVISCENATLISDSISYGSIVEAGSGYAEVSVRLCEVLASGAVFTADDTLSEFEGEGKDKIYAKPTLSVNFTASIYNVSENENSNASLFLGNVTGVVTASEIWKSENSAIAIGTRLWDGECGVLIKYGCKIITTANFIESELEAPLTDEDGAVIYFNPNSATNKNFSLDTINGEACKLCKKTETRENNSILVYYVVGIEAIDSFIDVDKSSNFDDDRNLVSDLITHAYGETTRPTITGEDGVSNKFFQWEYDKNKKDQYDFKGTSTASYLNLSGGNSSGATREFDALAENEFITWDFDIANSNGSYPGYVGLKLFARPTSSDPNPNIGSFGYTTDFGEIRGLNLTVGGVSHKLPATPYEWTHITFVFEIDYSESYEEDGVTCYPNLHRSMMHFYVNGIHKTSIKIFNDNIKTQDGLVRTSGIALDCIRFSMLKDTSIDKDTSVSICLDNSIVTYYPKGYKGDINEVVSDNTLNLNEASDVVYKKGYHVPGKGAVTVDDRTPTANVDGANYYDMDEALAAISEGSEVRLYQDVEEIYNVNSSFTIYTDKKDGSGNYKFTVVSDGYYLSEIRENGNLLGYRTAPTNKFVTIFWQVNTGYETKVPLGVIPEYDGIMPTPKADSFGRSYSLVGWSSERNATEPEALGSITRDDVAKGYKIYYPVYAPTKILVSFVDEAGNEIYSDFYGEGEIPECDVNKYFEGYEDNGRYIAPIGWSTDKLASEPDTIPAITNDDILGSKIVYHPIKGVSKVKVTFLNEKQSPIKTEWISVGTPIKELINYIPEATFPTKIDSTNSSFNFDYSGWLLESGMSTVGADPVNAIPHFNYPILKDVKYSYTIQRLTSIAPKLFVNVPDLIGYSKDGVELISKANGGQGKAILGGVEYNVLDGGATYTNTNSQPVYAYSDFVTKVNDSTTLTLYIHFEYEGETYIQSVDISFNAYLDNSIAAAVEAGGNENTLKVLMETVRLSDAYAKLSGQASLPVCEKYLSDKNFTKYLYDYTKVSSLISEDTKTALQTNLDGLFSHFEKTVRWDFVNNYVYFSPITSVHPDITNGYGNPAVFFRVNTGNVRAYTSLYETSSKYVYYSTEGAKSVTTLTGGVSGTFVVMLGSQTYGVQSFGGIANGTSDRITVLLQANGGNGGNLANYYYSLSAHILELERRVEAGEMGLEKELEMAQIIYSTQYSYASTVSENNGKDLDFSNLWK